MDDTSEERQLLVSHVGKTTVVNMESHGGGGRLSSPEVVHHVHHHHGDAPDPENVLDLNEVDDEDDLDSEGLDAEEQRRALRFEEMLRRSQEEDLSSIEESNCIYRAGYDKQGRAVIVFIGKWFRHSRLDLHKALLYLLRIVDPVASDDYVVVYFHTRTSRDNIPSYWWIKEVYNTLTYKYKKHLKAFYVVHPTLWTKMTCWWFSTFMAPAIKNKIQNVHALKELSAVVDHKDLSIPMFVTEQDMVFNGIRYYKP